MITYILLALVFLSETSAILPDEERAIFPYSAIGRERLSICFSLACLRSIFSDDRYEDKILVYVTSHDIRRDMYFELFAGAIFDMLRFCDFHMVIDSFTDNFAVEKKKGGLVVRVVPHYSELSELFELKDCVRDSESVSRFSYKDCMHMLQVRSEHLSLLHEFLPFRKKLAIIHIQDAMRIDLLFSNVFMYIHLNDEMPWNQPKKVMELTVKRYSLIPIVLRNIYYSSLISTSIYLPLRSGRTFTYSSAHKEKGMQSNNVLNISERSILCFFMGSFSYEHLNNTVKNTRLDMLEALHDFPHCLLPTSPDTPRVSQERHSTLVARSQFVLCPAGLNHETGRLHEALELGAIPLFLKVQDPEKNFLAEWPDYPGPVLSSWAEARMILESVHEGNVRLDLLDEIQAQLRVWYGLFTANISLKVKHAVDNAYKLS